MIGDKGSTIIFYAAVCFFAAFFAVWLLDFLLFRIGWCVGVETACLREWIGATSGWAAASVAGITIHALYVQIQEQRKQTEFALGHALPTVTARSPKGRTENVELRVVNWNRHSVDILDVRVVSDPALRRPLCRILIGGDVTPFQQIEHTDEIVRLEGWENRAAPPPSANVMVYLAFEGEKPGDPETIVRASFEVDLLLLGEVQRVITAKAAMNMPASDIASY